MFSKNHKKKYLRYTDSVDEDNNNSDESENGKGNIDLIINKLERKINTGNINSGNADVILKVTSQNQETTRTTKNNDSLINNISNLLPNNIKENNNELSQDIGNSIISVNWNQKDIRASKNSIIVADINLNKELNDNLEEKESNGANKYNVILTNNNLNPNFNNNNNLLSRNKILNGTDNNSTNNLSTLSQQFDNSRYFLNKKNVGLISANKIEKENKEKDGKEKEKNNINEELSVDKKKKKGKGDKNDRNKHIKKKYNYKYNSFCSYYCDKRRWKRRWRNFSVISAIRNTFITIIVVSAIAFYATIFFLS